MIRFRLAALILLVPLASGAPAQVSGCAGAEHRQFDFWVGEWSIIDQTSGHPAGTSHIEKLYGGCVLRENYAAGSFRGGSLNSYWRGDGKWHQTWMDSTGAFRHFLGGVDRQGQMVMTAEQPNAGRTRLVRLTYTANPDGTVRQYSDYSDDSGRSWSLRYDYLYRPLAR